MSTKSTTARICYIEFDADWDEYRVPNEIEPACPPTRLNKTYYFTNDKDDAIGTAKHMHGDDVVIRFRKIRTSD